MLDLVAATIIFPACVSDTTSNAISLDPTVWIASLPWGTVLAQAASLAQAADDTAPPPPGGSLMSFLPMFLGIGFIFYFLIIRPANRERRDRDTMLSSLKKGDRIVTRGGLIGRIVDVRDREFVVKVDETNNTRVHIYRTFVLTRLTDDKDAKPDEKLAS